MNDNVGITPEWRQNLSNLPPSTMTPRDDMPVLTISFDDDVVRRLQRKDAVADDYREATGYEGPVGVDMLAPGLGPRVPRIPREGGFVGARPTVSAAPMLDAGED